MQCMDYNNLAVVYSHFCMPGQGHFWLLWLQEGEAACCSPVPRLRCGGSPPSVVGYETAPWRWTRKLILLQQGDWAVELSVVCAFL